MKDQTATGYCRDKQAAEELKAVLVCMEMIETSAQCLHIIILQPGSLGLCLSKAKLVRL